MIYFTGRILSETLFIAMLAWGIALVAVENRKVDVSGFLILVLSILVRPAAVLLPVVISFLLPRRKIYLLIFFVVIGGWMMRNKARSSAHWVSDLAQR